MRVLTVMPAAGTRPLCRDARIHGESWRVSGPAAVVTDCSHSKRCWHFPCTAERECWTRCLARPAHTAAEASLMSIETGNRSRVVGLALLLGAALAGPARAEAVLRVAMTAGDIPDWTGQPDQGFEGLRFVGWSLHDSLINWDLSRGDREPPLRPGLATKWYIDPSDNKKWIFELRRGVKFHDGCP